MKWASKIFLVSSLLIYSNAIADSLAKFDSKNHSKANGLWLTVRYPSYWRSLEGERPHIVQKWDNLNGDFFEGMMLQINPLPKHSIGDIKNLTNKNILEVYQSIMPNTKVYGVKKFTHEGQTAFIGDIYYSGERVTQRFYIAQRLMLVFYKDNLIMLYCGSGSQSEDHNQLNNHQKLLSVSKCQQFFNSLILMDRY